MEIDQTQLAKEIETPVFNPDWTKNAPKLNSFTGPKVENSAPSSIENKSSIPELSLVQLNDKPAVPTSKPGDPTYFSDRQFNPKLALSPSSLGYVGALTGISSGDRALGKGFSSHLKAAGVHGLSGYAIGCGTASAYNYFSGSEQIPLSITDQYIGAGAAGASLAWGGRLAGDLTGITKPMQELSVSSFSRNIAGGALVGIGAYQAGNIAESCFGKDSAITKALEPNTLSSGLAAAGFAAGRNGKSKAIFSTLGYISGQLLKGNSK